MKKFLQTVFAAFLAVSMVSAQTTAVETFDYAAGAAKDLGATSNGWGGAWTLGPDAKTDSIKIVAGSLSKTGLATTGNKLEIRSLAAAGSAISRNLATTWADVTGVEYWVSFLFEVKNGPAINDSWQGFSLDNAGEQAYFGKLWGMDKLGINDPEPYLNVATTTAYTAGTAWMVARIKMSGDAAVDTAYLWLNPDPSAKPKLSAATKADITLNNGFNAIRVHLGMAAGIKVTVDEIRVGKSWADVTSPAATGLSKKAKKQNVSVINSANKVTFNYDLKTAENVKIEIYSAEGKLVRTVVSAKQSAGQHNASLNTNDLQNGIYIYKIQIGNEIETGKTLL